MSSTVGLLDPKPMPPFAGDPRILCTENDLRHGVFGGYTAAGRRALLKRRTNPTEKIKEAA